MSIVPESTDAGIAGSASSIGAWTPTVGAALSNGILVAFFEFGEGSLEDHVTAATYNGVSLTQFAHAFGGAPAFNINLDIWYLTNPPAGSFTLAATFDRSVVYSTHALVCSGVNLGGPWRGAGQTANGAVASSPSLGITTVAGDLAIDVVSDNFLTSLTVGGSQTAIGIRNNVGSAWSFGTSYQSASGSTTTNTWTPSNQNAWQQLGGALIPAIEGGSVINLHTSRRGMRRAIRRGMH